MEGWDKVLDIFVKIAPHLTNPLVLVGFVALMFFSVHKALLSANLLNKPDPATNSFLRFLRPGVVLSILVISLAGCQIQEKGLLDSSSRQRGQEIIRTLTDVLNKKERMVRHRPSHVQALTLAVQALLAHQPDSEEALQELAHGRTVKAAAFFGSLVKQGETPEEQAEAARHQGALAFYHDTEKSLAAYQLAVVLAPDHLLGWFQLGRVLVYAGEFVKAETACQRVWELSEKEGDTAMVAQAISDLGSLQRHRGFLTHAEEMFTKSFSLYQELDDKHGMADQLSQLGHLAFSRGDVVGGEGFHNRAIALLQVLGDKEGMANEYESMGLLNEFHGDKVVALEMYNKSLSLDVELGHKKSMAHTYSNMGRLYRSSRDSTKSQEMFLRAVDIVSEVIKHELETGHVNADLYRDLGGLYDDLGNESQAEEMYLNSLAILIEQGDKMQMAILHGDLGVFYRSRNQLSRAEEMFNMAITLYQEMGSKSGIALDSANLGALYEDRGELERARETWQRAEALFREAGDEPLAKTVSNRLRKLGKKSP